MHELGDGGGWDTIALGLSRLRCLLLRQDDTKHFQAAGTCQLRERGLVEKREPKGERDPIELGMPICRGLVATARQSITAGETHELACMRSGKAENELHAYL